MPTMHDYIDRVLSVTNNPIYIVSGEGERGTVHRFRGTRSIRALKARLTRERCNGQRWARCSILSHYTNFGAVYVDLETGEYR